MVRDFWDTLGRFVITGSQVKSIEQEHLLWPEKIPRAAHNMYRLARFLLILPN